MLPLSTEFPVRPLPNRAAFVAEVVTWLQGTAYSTVLASESEADLDGETAQLRAANGEELRLRELKEDGDFVAIGFRHDFPDDEGRIWRTECVLRRSVAEDDQDLVRLRTQCLARTPRAYLESPRKPYLIKALLKNGWGGTDGILAVCDQPVWLPDSDKGLTTARAVTLGEATTWLPTVYVSATGKRAWLVNEKEIEELAYALGGIAHVVVEPTRAFSFSLRDETDGRNAYGGTIGLSLPGQGIIRRYYIGWRLREGRELVAAVREAATNLRGQMPAFGWDWTDLQERALRAQREAFKGALSAVEGEALFNDYVKQLEDLQAENRQLKEQLRSRPVSAEVGTDEGGVLK